MSRISGMFALFSFFSFGCATPMKAVKENDLDTLKSLAADGADLEEPDISGQTPLMLAARSGRVQILEFLIAEGVNLNGVDNAGRTALSHAVRYDSTNAVAALVDGGVDTNRADGNGDFALHLASSWSQERARRLYGRRVQKVIGIDPSGRYITSESESWLPGRWDSPPEELVSLLIEKGAVVEVRTKDGRTPLMLAASANNLLIVQTLLAAGANPELKDPEGSDALWYANRRLKQARSALGAFLNRPRVVERFVGQYRGLSAEFTTRESENAEADALKKIISDQEEIVRLVGGTVDSPGIGVEGEAQPRE